MKLTIHGPNLNDQSNGSFHVHTSRCRDNKREVANNGSEQPTTHDFDTVEDVVDYIYPPEQFERDPSDPQDVAQYTADFHFAPCVKNLPHREVETSKHPSPETIAAADEQIAAELQNVDLDAAVAAATSEPAAKPARKRSEKLQLPTGTTPARLVLAFVTECASDAPDAGGQQRPFITHTNKLVIHAQWFRAWLQTNRERLFGTLDIEVTTSQAVQILRDDLKFADRSVAVIGAPTKNLSVWMIDAPRTMKSIERQAAPERKSAPAATPAADAPKPAAKRKSTRKSTSKSSK